MPIGFISDRRMLELIELLKTENKIRFTQEFCDAIGFKKQNIRNVKMGAQHFTPEHIRKACKAFKRNANWIFDLEREPVRDKISIMPLPKKLPKSLENSHFSESC